MKFAGERTTKALCKGPFGVRSLGQVADFGSIKTLRRGFCVES